MASGGGKEFLLRGGYVVAGRDGCFVVEREMTRHAEDEFHG